MLGFILLQTYLGAHTNVCLNDLLMISTEIVLKCIRSVLHCIFSRSLLIIGMAIQSFNCVANDHSFFIQKMKTLTKLVGSPGLS